LFVGSILHRSQLWQMHLAELGIVRVGVLVRLVLTLRFIPDQLSSKTEKRGVEVSRKRDSITNEGVK